jgi:hypothetical protein
MTALRPWEDTLIIALRDFQWYERIHHVAHKIASAPGTMGSSNRTASLLQDVAAAVRSVYPPGFAKLDGRAEERVSDLLLQSDSARFFVLEAKADRSRIRTEWMRKGKFLPKPVYRRLKDLVDRVNAGATHDLRRMLQLSLAGHHVVYWGPIRRSDLPLRAQNGRSGDVFCEPYICAVARQESLLDHCVLDLLRLEAVECVFSAGNPRAQTAGRARFQDVYRHGVETRIAINGDTELYPCGLTRDELAEYLAYLCSNFGGSETPESIRMVVLSDDGSFFALLASMRDLGFFANVALHRPTPKP